MHRVPSLPALKQWQASHEPSKMRIFDAFGFIAEKHGKQNILMAAIHRDETTPHAVAYVVPKDERGKLNCRAFYGEKNALTKLQDEFSEQVGAKHGLERVKNALRRIIRPSGSTTPRLMNLNAL